MKRSCSPRCRAADSTGPISPEAPGCTGFTAGWLRPPFIYKYSHFLDGDFEWFEWIPRVIVLVSIPMLLHGLYDVLLKKEMNGLALVAALVSFAWFAWLVETSRSEERGTSRARLRHA